jgi:branched-chain amino acid transport system permease protein
VINLALIFVILVVGFNFTFGYAGQLSLGHIAFYAIGAYCSAVLTADHGFPRLPAMLVGVAVSAVIAWLLGAVTAGLRSHYLALATLGLAEIVNVVLVNWRDVTHGNSGVVGIPRFGSGDSSETTAYYILLAVVVIGIVLAWRFQMSSWGRAATALRESERGAAAVGIRPVHLKITVLVISAVYASVAGSLYSHTVGFVSPDTFTVAPMVLVVSMAIVGGKGLISGAVLGAVALTILPEFGRSLDEYWMLVYGCALLLLVTRMPYGIMGLVRALWLRRRRANGHVGAPVPRTVAIDKGSAP